MVSTSHNFFAAITFTIVGLTEGSRSCGICTLNSNPHYTSRPHNLTTPDMHRHSKQTNSGQPIQLKSKTTYDRFHAPALAKIPSLSIFIPRPTSERPLRNAQRPIQAAQIDLGRFPPKKLPDRRQEEKNSPD